MKASGSPSAGARPLPGARLASQGVSVRAGGRELVRDLSVSFAAGEFVAVLGRNGSGKSLTLHTLAGLRSPDSGTVSLDALPLQDLDRLALARRIGLLTQDFEATFPATALQTVLIGRHPHLRFWQWESDADEVTARTALEAVDLGDCGERNVDTLSGGEHRRVAIAALLTQAPEVYLLDEPTNHLDPHHQLAVLTRFRALADRGSTVVAAVHDPTLAARFADRVLLLFGDGRWRIGPVSEVLSGASLSELYLTPMTEIRDGSRRVFVSL